MKKTKNSIIQINQREIADAFGYLTKSTVACTRGHTRTTECTEHSLTVEFPEAKRTTAIDVQRELQLLVSAADQISASVECTGCFPGVGRPQKVSSTRSRTIESLPPSLVIHVARSTYKEQKVISTDSLIAIVVF